MTVSSTGNIRLVVYLADALSARNSTTQAAGAAPKVACPTSGSLRHQEIMALLRAILQQLKDMEPK